MRQPNKVAVLTPDDSITYEALLDRALALAASLRSCGIVAGDVVAHQLPNGWHSCAVDLAVASLVAVVAPFPPGRGRLDIESLLRRCDARAIIVPPTCGDLDLCPLIESLRPTMLSLRHLIVDGDSREGWTSLDRMMQAEPLRIDQLPMVDADDPVRLLVSSGTESEPKLVAYSHNALVGGRGRFLQRLHSDGTSFRGMYLVPLGSSFGSSATFGALSWLGGSLALLPHFDTADAIRAIGTLKPTHVLGVPRAASGPAAGSCVPASRRPMPTATGSCRSAGACPRSCRPTRSTAA